MRSLLRSALLASSAALVLTALSGCGSQKVVTGKITNKGQPLPVSEKGVIQVTFATAAPSGKSAHREVYPAVVQPDGTFKVAGPEEKGIEPGKYQISVQLLDPYPAVDRLRGYFAPGKTPIVREVKGGAPLEIDLARPQG